MVDVTGTAAGGDAIGRLADGRVVFVEGALAGERVVVEFVQQRKDFARGRVQSVEVASPDRVVPPCPRVGDGCGGCQWQHSTIDAQRRAKRDVVVDALRRIGRIPDADSRVTSGPRMPDARYRTTIRVGVDSTGRAGFRGRSSHDLVVLDGQECLTAHPRLARLAADGRFPGARELLMRTSVATGETVVMVLEGELDRQRCRLANVGPVQLVDLDDLGVLHEVVAGHRFRVSATSFFQVSPVGAEALVALVGEAATAGIDARSFTLLDLYSGVGLFGATVGARFGRVVAVESHEPAVEDAWINLAATTAAQDVVAADVTHWDPHSRLAEGERAVVIADPARTGLGRAGVHTVEAAHPDRIVLVSCDPASLGRDCALLVEAGYEWRATTMVDLFPHTFHIEAVSRFDRRSAVVTSPAR